METDETEDAAKKRIMLDLIAAATGEEVVDVDIAAPELQTGGAVLFAYRVAGSDETRTHALPMEVVIDALGGGESIGEADEEAGARAAASVLAQHGASVMLVDGDAYLARAREILAELKTMAADPAFFSGDAGVDAFDHYLAPLGLRALFGPPIPVGLAATPATLQVVERRPDAPVGGVAFTFLGVGPTADEALAQLAKAVARLTL